MSAASRKRGLEQVSDDSGALPTAAETAAAAAAAAAAAMAAMSAMTEVPAAVPATVAAAMFAATVTAEVESGEGSEGGLTVGAAGEAESYQIFESDDGSDESDDD